MEILSTDILKKSPKVEIKPILSSVHLKHLPKVLFQLIYNGYFVNGKFKLCEHDWQFISIIGSEHCHKCNKWNNIDYIYEYV